jgi:hypothetical protein
MQTQAHSPTAFLNIKVYMTLTYKDFLLISEELNFIIATDDFWLHSGYRTHDST